MRCVGCELNRQMLPPAPILTIAALATVCPAAKLRLDASGGSMPHGYAVTKPGASGSVTVTLITTVDAPAGTPPRPMTVTASTVQVGCTPAPTNCPSMVVEPMRVSSKRPGSTATYEV